jgi:hypothetical protein
MESLGVAAAGISIAFAMSGWGRSNNRTHEIAVNPLTRLKSRSVMRRGEVSAPLS